tara:strand:+ start:502 stop:1314 length:813 start_codon:yes stop_codon:yes gene_type:complete
MSRIWWGGKCGIYETWPDLGFTKRFEETTATQTLLLSPTLPESILAYKVHPELCKQLGGLCIASFRFQENLFVVLASAEHARSLRGQPFTFQGEKYHFEYTTFHSKAFVCHDVMGLTTNEVLLGLDALDLAETETIGVFRQKDNGPVLALYFSEPLKATFWFEVKVDRHVLRFRRACSFCLICGSQHEVPDCVQMAEVREPTRPGGTFVLYKQQVLHERKVLGKLINKISETDWDKHPVEAAQAYDSVQTWAWLNKEIESRPFKRLGYPP